jgi:hypothetical protein
MKGIEHKLNGVVVLYVFAAGEMGANLGGIVEADEDDVEILLVVPEIGDGALGGRGAVVGIALDEAFGDGHERSGVSGGAHLKKVFEDRLVIEAGDDYGGLRRWDRS